MFLAEQVGALLALGFAAFIVGAAAYARRSRVLGFLAGAFAIATAGQMVLVAAVYR